MPSSKPFFRFLLILLGSYAFWKLAEYALDQFQPLQWGLFKDRLSALTVGISAWMASHFFGLQSIHNSRNIIAVGTVGIFLADHCLAVPAMVVFTLVILFNPGSWFSKLWYVPFGIALIILTNSFRIAGLAYFQKYYSALFFAFVHNYVYLVMTYGIIFLMIVAWMEIFSVKR